MLSVSQYFQNNNSQITENIIFSEENIKYNLEEWIKSKDRKLFITGYTGSGKSTLSNWFSQKYNIEIIELDNYIQVDNKHVEKLKKKQDISQLHQYYQNVIDYHIDELLKNNKKLIIEGIQIIMYTNFERLEEHSIIFIGTSAIRSLFRAYKRNKNKDFSKDWSVLHIFLDIYHNLFIRKTERLIKLVKSWKTN